MDRLDRLEVAHRHSKTPIFSIHDFRALVHRSASPLVAPPSIEILEPIIIFSSLHYTLLLVHSKSLLGLLAPFETLSRDLGRKGKERFVPFFRRGGKGMCQRASDGEDSGLQLQLTIAISKDSFQCEGTSSRARELSHTCP